MPPELLYTSLNHAIRPYLDAKEQARVKQAFDLAKQAHHGTKRDSGEEYLAHPVQVALTLAGMELDADTVIAGLLHDVVEDAGVSLKSIEQTFGSDVAGLVSGVTKLSQVQMKSPSFFLPAFLQRQATEQQAFERQVESLRKMLLAMTDDIRVILIKLADRLHNMRTLDAVRPDKRARVALETLEIYAPLAYRLGMGDIKGQLEDLAFPYVYPREYLTLKQQVGEQLAHRETQVKHFQKVLRAYLESESMVVLGVHGRVKHLYSLRRKLERLGGDLAKVYDLIAIRILVPTTADCYQALGLIHSRWNPLLGRIKDYIATPKPNGYRSLHTTVFGLDGEIIEIQIRTPEMHEQAEFGIAAHWQYSEGKHAAGKAQQESHSKLEWLKELKRWQTSLKDPNDLKAALKLDFFSDQIFVFTPQGDVINLPAESTPVDFAYAIHSDLGDACVGAKVGGKLTSLETQLQNGDIVDIQVSKHPTGPKRGWLQFAKTQKARVKIKQHFNLT